MIPSLEMLARRCQEATEALKTTPPAATVNYPAHVRAAAVAGCRRTTAQWSRTFYFASALLPRAKRDSVRCLYAFCRTIDDLVDANSDGSAETLNAWERRALGDAPREGHHALIGWCCVRAEYRIPNLFAQQLIEAVRSDIGRVRYATYDELAQYCYGVASTVGLMSMCVIGYATLEAVPYAITLGVALQLTNVLRDVAEDWKRGRVYLPAEDLAHFGVTEADLSAGRVSERWRKLMRFEVERARRLYRESWPGIGLLDQSGRFAVAAASGLYGAILDDIEAHDYNVFVRRAHVSGPAKVARLPSIWRDARHLAASR